MIYAGNLIKINGNIIPKIVSYKVGQNKLWKDAERNMAGQMRATLVGVFPKIEIDIGMCTQDEIKAIVLLLNNAFVSVEYFDITTALTHTAEYYAADFTVEFQNKAKGLYKPFSVSLIPVTKR